ncbi:helix-turn-helix domain-containing protein [Shewanella japonica]|uniref:helix-turn-helix domain-containing protein n=1 Tax=Shewanella japonica TaxID=93973 RepID=UPI0013C4B5DE
MERGIPVAEIARTVKCHRSTIYRELKRSGKTKCYCLDEAHIRSVHLRQSSRKYRIPRKQVEFIEYLVGKGWSPEQITNVLTAIGQPVSHEWI